MFNTFHDIAFLQLAQCSMDQSFMTVLYQTGELLSPERLEVRLQLAKDQLDRVVPEET